MARIGDADSQNRAALQAEIRRYQAEQDRAARRREVERAVIEAAKAWRRAEMTRHIFTLQDAVDALLEHEAQ